VTEPFNLFAAELEDAADAPTGYRRRTLSVGRRIGAERLGGSIYELDPGESICPYHYEIAEEEWLLVLTGTPTLRDPEGEHELVRGDLVCFPQGEAGAHKVTNRGDTVARVLMLSTIPKAVDGFPISICVYPDSRKVGVWPPGGRFRLSESVGYWDGEA
jgi:uncharacterized cupin superfamily protein